MGLGASLETEYPLVPRYTKYAALYDDLGQEQFALYLLVLIETVVQRYRLRVRTVVDVPCGTGAASIALARRGYRVVGVDGSAEMLRIARQKSQNAGVEVELRRQDMTRLRLDLTADLILSLYDSVNYLLTIEEMAAAFQGVAAALNPGGLFIFDVNTVRCLETEWGNRITEEKAKLSSLIHLYSYDAETQIGTLELVGVRSGPEGIERFREIHRERGYRYAEVAGALDRCGLEIKEAYSFPDLSAPDDSASRLIFVAGKRAPGVGRGALPRPADAGNTAGNPDSLDRGEDGSAGRESRLSGLGHRALPYEGGQSQDRHSGAAS